MYDVIIIGAGVGGLSCGAKLAMNGKKTMIIEKIHHVGGTSHVFRRGDYIFPMGPLSFSYPELVKELLKRMGIKEEIKFKRNHFQLISPEIDIIYSEKLNKLKEKLKNIYKNEEQGIESFFNELYRIIECIRNIHEWHPDFLIGRARLEAKKRLKDHEQEFDLINKYNELSSKKLLNEYLKNDILKRLLGSQGTYQPMMNMVHLAFMWNVMSEEGIWFPSCGIHGINQLLHDSFLKNGGELKLNSPVKEILIDEDQVYGVETLNGQKYEAEWVVANADYKKVFLELIPPSKLPKNHVENVKNTAYTGSEFCVYLGFDPEKVNLSKMRANHLFYRKRIDLLKATDPEDFENKEIEICLWSNKSSEFAPKNKKSLILRVNMPYDHFDVWRTGEKQRKEGYKDYKKSLALKLIKTVECIFPGLNSSIEIMEIATPLTYRDWGQRYLGSVAGWTRDIKKIRLNTKLLLEKPIKHLLMVGIYSVLEPFLGGYPVSMYTGNLAADLILEQKQ